MLLGDVISYMRMNMNVQPVGATAPLSLSDEQLVLYLSIVATKDFPKLLIGDEIENKYVYPLVLLAKRELYFNLATTSAPKDYNLEADGASLSKNQIWEHYMKLVQEVDKQYSQYLKEGGVGGMGNTLTSADVVIGSRNNTNRNYRLSTPPEINTSIQVYTDKVDIDIKDNTFHTSIYIDKNPLYDEYIGVLIEKPSLKEGMFDKIRIEGLESKSLYYVLVVCSNTLGKKSYKHISFTTKEVVSVNAGL